MKRRSSKLNDSPENYVDIDPDRFIVKFVNSRVGYGLFAKQNFRADDFLLFYRGKIIKETDLLASNDYLFHIPSHKIFIDGSDKDHGGMAKFINDDHRSPNARAVLYRLETGDVMIALKSKTFIEKGQEIRYDYLHGNTTGDCPWRNVSFISKIIQCSIEPQNTELDINLVSETHLFAKTLNLRESACQANEEETSHEEVSDDYITDPLYTSTSEVTLGTQDTESEVQAAHKRSSESKHEAANSAHPVTNIDFSLLWVRCHYSGFFP